MALLGFRTRITLLFGLLTIGVATMLSLALGSLLSRYMVREQGESLDALARSASVLLAQGLSERIRELELVAGDRDLAAASLDSAPWSQELRRIKRARPEYAWLGVADATGLLRASTDGRALAPLSPAPLWFARAKAGGAPFVGDGPPRGIDIGVPIAARSGEIEAVLGARATWNWAGELLRSMRHEGGGRGVAVFVIDRERAVIHRPAEVPAGAVLSPTAIVPPEGSAVVAEWSDGDCLTASAPLVLEGRASDLGWVVVVRQPIDLATRPALDARRAVLATGLLVSALAMVIVWLVAGRVSHLDRSVRLQTAELVRANRELERLARHDELTGLANRRAADARLSEELARHVRSGRPMAVLMADIDHFKRINDTHGHAAGDEVLRQVAQRIVETCRGTDFVARFGGEEFLILLPDTDATGAVHAAEKIRTAVRETDLGEPLGEVTLSIGVAVRMPPTARASQAPVPHATSVEAILGVADGALYEAKRGGRDRVVANVVHGVDPLRGQSGRVQRRAG